MFRCSAMCYNIDFNSDATRGFDSSDQLGPFPEPDTTRQLDSMAESIGRWKPSRAAEIETLLSWAEEMHIRAPESLVRAIALVSPGAPALPWLQSYVLQKTGEFSSAEAILDSFTAPSKGLDNEVESLRLYSLASLNVSMECWARAAQFLALSIRLTERFTMLRRSFALLNTIERSHKVPYKRNYRVALVGNATLDSFLPAIKCYAFATGIGVTLYAGLYDQHCQEILDTSSRLSAFEPEIIIIATNWRSLFLDEEYSDQAAVVRKHILQIINMWRICRERWGAFVIQHGFEVPLISAFGRLSAAVDGGRARIIRRINLSLMEAADLKPDVAMLDIEQIAGREGKQRWNDERLWIAAKQYPALNCIPFLARNQVALIRAYAGLMSKCIVLDLDETLWGGIIGEDGLKGIALGGSAEGESFREFQRYLKALRTRGIMLAICSSNDETEAKSPFVEHPETILKLDDFAVFVANWRSKSENLLYIAQALNIAEHSIVFVDNSAVERALVRRELPEVEVPELPADPALFPAAIDRTLAFEAISLTNEDRLRSAHSAQQSRKIESIGPCATLDEYLAALKMRMMLHPLDQKSIPRVVQLLGKTNQFNLTTRRLTVRQVEEYMRDPVRYTQTACLSDRFTDYGLTGVLLGASSGEELLIEIWLMSCRVLGRCMEDAMLAAAWNWAYSRGLKRIGGFYLPTPKNGLVARLYDRLGFTLLEQDRTGARKYTAELTSIKKFPPCVSVEEASV